MEDQISEPGWVRFTKVFHKQFSIYVQMFTHIHKHTHKTQRKADL